MVAGKKYDIRVIWSENGGGAAWRVGWSSPSIPQEVIPDAVLYEPDATVKPLKPASLTARASASRRSRAGGTTLQVSPAWSAWRAFSVSPLSTR